MAFQIDIEWPETGNQVGRSFTATGSVWDDTEMFAAKAAMVDVECTLSNATNSYTNKTTISLPGAGESQPWSVPLPASGVAATGTYTLTAVLKLTMNPPSDAENNIQVVQNGPSHGDIIFDVIEE